MHDGSCPARLWAEWTCEIAPDKANCFSHLRRHFPTRQYALANILI